MQVEGPATAHRQAFLKLADVVATAITKTVC